MTNPVTPNIGLNKIDRTSPSTTYFDLEKYIDQNADAVDRFAGETSEAINALEKRLDTEERREVVLQPGLQIVTAERSAPFKLRGIKGRTLVNLLGRDGDCEDVSKWPTNAATVVLDTTNKMFGSSSIKVTNTTSGTYGSAYRMTPEIANDKYYLIAGFVKLGVGSGAGLTFLNKNGANVFCNKISNASNFELSYMSLSPSDIGTGTTAARLKFDTGSNVATDYAYYDGIRIYEITQAEYAALVTMIPEQVAAKYPYVDSVQPVRNPYAIRYGENLLPPFYEWGHINNKGKILLPYSYLQPEYDPGTWTNISISCKPFTDYTLSFESVGGARIRITDNKTPFSILLDLTDTGGAFNSGDNTTLSVYIDAGIVGQVNNPMLTIGYTPKLFKPREYAMLALQTDLYADPLTGANADHVFEKDGQYFKLAKWKKTIMNGSEDVSYGSSASGYKTIRLPKVDRDFSAGFYITKYDGKQLTYSYNAVTGADQFRQGPGESFLFLTVSNTDSGWGDNYTPTADEIKAYFMGWVMYPGMAVGDNPTNKGPYNGTGEKWWVRRGPSGPNVWADATKFSPTTLAADYKPYQLVYQLATPTVEPIVSEGMLTFNEGDNQIVVGSGIVTRENNSASVASNGVATFNGATYPLKNRAAAFIGLYKDSISITPDSSGFRTPGSALEISNGPAWASLNKERYEASAAYSVTYLMLDKSPSASFTGTYAANEKLMIQELTDAVQQNATSISVLMNKKADRDTPGWITPTLINGWIPYADSTHYYGYTTAQYMKDSQGFVYLRGLIKKGSPSTIFYLPIGYRPKQSITFVTICYDGSTEQVTRIRISSDGSVSYVVGPAISAEASWLSLNLPPFTID